MIAKPTRTGWLLGGLAFLLYLASMTSRSGLLFLILGILFAVFIINFLIARRSCQAIQVVPSSTTSCSEGEVLQEGWVIRNRGSGNAGFIRLHGGFGTLLRIGSLPGGEQAHMTPELRMENRGVYPFSLLKVTSTYPFGLFEFSENRDIPGEIIVFPSVYKCAPPPAAGFEPMLGGKFHGQTRSSIGDSFHGVRPYRGGDPVKLIHWKSSAKGLGMMAKEFDEELSGRVGIVFVGCTAGKNGSEHLDWAARAAGSLVLSALDEGHQIEFVVAGQDELIQVPPFADGSTVMTALARLKGGHAVSSEELMKAIWELPPKSSLCIVSPVLNDTVRSVLGQIPANRLRYSMCYLPEVFADETGDLPAKVRLFGPNYMVEGTVER